MEVAAAALAVAVASLLVLRDIRRFPDGPVAKGTAPPAKPPAVPPAVPPAAATVERPPVATVTVEPTPLATPPVEAPPAATPAVEAPPAAARVPDPDLVLGRFRPAGTDQRPRPLRRVGAAFTLLVLTLALAAAVAATIYRAVGALG